MPVAQGRCEATEGGHITVDREELADRSCERIDPRFVLEFRSAIGPWGSNSKVSYYCVVGGRFS